MSQPLANKQKQFNWLTRSEAFNFSVWMTDFICLDFCSRRRDEQFLLELLKEFICVTWTMKMATQYFQMLPNSLIGLFCFVCLKIARSVSVYLKRNQARVKLSTLPRREQLLTYFLEDVHMTGSLAFKLFFSTFQLGYSPALPICSAADVSLFAFSATGRIQAGVLFLKTRRCGALTQNILF